MVLSEFCSALYWQAEKSSKRCVDLVLTHEDKLFYTWKKKTIHGSPCSYENECQIGIGG